MIILHPVYGFKYSFYNDNEMSIYGSNWAIGLMSRVFANGPEDRGSIPGRVILKTQRMVLDAAWLNIQHYMERINGNVEQSKEWTCAHPYTYV